MSTYSLDAHPRQLYPTADTIGIVMEGKSYNDFPSDPLPMECPIPRAGDRLNLTELPCSSSSHVAWTGLRG
jgi:hypothetical protein